MCSDTVMERKACVPKSRPFRRQGCRACPCCGPFVQTNYLQPPFLSGRMRCNRCAGESRREQAPTTPIFNVGWICCTRAATAGSVACVLGCHGRTRQESAAACPRRRCLCACTASARVTISSGVRFALHPPRQPTWGPTRCRLSAWTWFGRGCSCGRPLGMADERRISSWHGRRGWSKKQRRPLLSVAATD